MAKRYLLTVHQVLREASDVVIIQLKSPLNESIPYQPGQFLTFLLTINGTKLRRSYSLPSSPVRRPGQPDELLSVSVKRIPGGLASTYLYNSVKVGDVLETLAPAGRFVPDLAGQGSQTFILIGAGSGITPLFSMIKSILYARSDSQVLLIYGNRNQDSILYKTQLDAIQQQYGSSRFGLIHVLSQPTRGWMGLRGRLDQPLLLSLLGKVPDTQLRQAHVYMCGPGGMMAEARSALDRLAISDDRVYTENFDLPPNSTQGTRKDTPAKQTERFREVTVFYDGHEHRFSVAPSKTILEAALDLKIDLPYSCQMGICMSCLSRCTAGQVQMDEEASLSVAERQADYVLTCVAHPISQHVIIAID